MLTINDLLYERNCKLLYRAIRGSHAYGLATENSDYDEILVYATSLDNLYDLGKDYQPIIENETHDIVAYEIKRFCELLSVSNPNVLEALYIPEDCVLYVNEDFKVLIDNRDKFLSKQAFMPYVGYATSQIKKAKSLDKMISMEPIYKRDSILDHCYVPFKNGSTHLMNWLSMHNLNQRYCAASNVDNMANIVYIYYDFKQFFNEDNISLDDLKSYYEQYYEYYQNEDLISLIAYFNSAIYNSSAL